MGIFRRSASWCGAVAAAGLLWGAFAQAQTKPASSAPAPSAAHHPASKLDHPLWAELTPAQRSALEPLAGEWDRLGGLRKQKWLQIANKFSSMSPEKRQRAAEQMRAFIALTPEQRRQVRETYSHTKAIAPGQKASKWEQYQQLPEEQKKRLAAQAAAKRKPVVNPPVHAKPGAPVQHGAAASAPPAPPAATSPAPVTGTPNGK
jgi:hypothetical protein